MADSPNIIATLPRRDVAKRDANRVAAFKVFGAFMAEA
jgi:hypothetical protein